MPEDIDVVPLTVTIPQVINATSIIELIDPYASLRAIFVERDSISDIPDLWRDSCGFYILFSCIDMTGAYSVYVGKSDRDFTQRLRSHDNTKDYWTNALLVQRNSVENLSSTQSSYLEGALRDEFDQANHVTCRNIAPTGDSTLPVHERLLMRQIVDATFRMMLLRGYRKSLPLPENSVACISSGLSSHQVPPSVFSMSVPCVPLEGAGSEVQSPLSARSTEEETEYAQLSVLSSLSRRVDDSATAIASPLPKVYNGEDIFQTLRAWRLQKAREKKLSPAYVLDDRALHALADKMPATIGDLSCIAEIPQMKREMYGEDLLKILDSCR